MIEQIVLTYLNASLDAPVYTEKPTGLSSFVLIERTGGSSENRIQSATIAIQSYGSSMYEAANLNEKVKDAMRSIYALPSVSRAKLNSDYNFTDTTTKEYRYQAVFDVVYF